MHINFKKTKIASYVCLALTSTSVLSAEESTKTDDIEVIEVTGIRASLTGEIAAKRSSDAISDSILAEDIGKSSDENIAEALSRIAGISLDGDGNTITVRGIEASLNDIKLNGISMTSSNDDQAVDLSLFSADMLSRIDVIKSPSANQEEGSLGASINLQTRAPLSSKKSKYIFSAEARYNELNEETTPRFAFSFINNLSDNFGFSGSIYHDKKIKRQEKFSINGWDLDYFYDPNIGGKPLDENNPKDSIKTNIFDFDTGERLQSVAALTAGGGVKNQIIIDEKIKTGGSFTFQYQPSENTDIRLDTTFTRQDNSNISSQYQMRNFHKDVDAEHHVRRTAGEANTIYRYVSGNVGGIVQPRDKQSTTDNMIIGLNVEHFIGDDWVINGRVGYSDTQQNFTKHQFNWVGQNKANDLCSVDYVYGPEGDFLPELSTCGGFDGLDPTTLKMTQFRRFLRDVDDSKLSAYLDVERYIDDSFINSVEFGAKHTKRTKFVRDEGIRLKDLDEKNFDAVGITDNNITEGRFLEGIAPAGAPQSWIYPNMQETIDRIAPEGLGSKEFPTDPALSSSLDETTYGAYAQANFEFFDGEVRGNFGVRYAHSETSSFNESSISFMENIDYVRTFMALPENGGDPDQTLYKFPNGVTSSYDNWLPSATVTWGITDDLLFRAAAARVMARPKIHDLRSNYKLDADDPDRTPHGNGGNPHLEPFLADQYDIALEWYFEEAGLLSANIFYKDYISYTYSTTIFRTFADDEFPLSGHPGAPNCLTDPSSSIIPQPCALVDYSTKNNGGSADIKGLELSYQQHYDFLPGILQHLGSSINYTYADSETISYPEEPNSPYNHLPFPSTSKHSVGARVYWQNDWSSYRFAYAYRSESISTLTKGRNTYYTDARGTLDFSANFDITKNLKITVVANNLTNSYKKVVSTLTNPSEELAGLDGIFSETNSDLANLSDTRVASIENFGRTFRLSLRYQF